MPDNRRFKTGFTLIEILVVLVIMAILMGLLLPALARAKEQARITQCKANLKQLGMALIAYSGDFGERSPATYGWNHFPGENDSYGNPRQWDRADERISSFMLFGPSSPMRRATGVDAVASGLGLFWSSGHLTNKGARIFYCPSSRHQSVDDEMTGATKRKWQFDFDEPIWTASRLTAGEIEDGQMPSMAPMLSNRNNIGDMGDTGNTDVASGGYKEFGDAVLTNYWVRTNFTRSVTSDYHVDQSRRYNTWGMTNEMDPQYKGALVADFIGGNWPQATWLGDGSTVINPSVFIQNHDAVYNVLFQDGSVRTFSDGGNKIRQMIRDLKASTNNDLMCDVLSANVFPAYFDPLLSNN